MSTEEKKQETPEVPNAHLAAIHANDNKNVVQEKAEAEKKEREANKIEPGVNSHLADVHAGKVNEKGENVETVTVPDSENDSAPADTAREGGPSSAPAENTTEAPAENGTEAPAENTTEAPAENGTEAPAENTTEAPAENGTEAPAENTTEAPVENATEAGN